MASATVLMIIAGYLHDINYKYTTDIVWNIITIRHKNEKMITDGKPFHIFIYIQRLNFKIKLNRCIHV